MEVWVKFGMSYQKPCNWLNKKLANTHVNFTGEKQSKAHLFQQQTDKHCCSFHPLSGHAIFQQSSSCKTALRKSCIHSLDGLGNVLLQQTAATQTLVTTFKDVTKTLSRHHYNTHQEIINKGQRIKLIFNIFVFNLVVSTIFYLLKMILGFFIILLVRLWQWIYTRHTSRQSRNSKMFF